jgi:hypothetical protein
LVLLVLTIAWPLQPLFAEEAPGTLRLTIKDGATGRLVPARVEILGADEVYYVAEDALELTGDCEMSDPRSGPVDAAASLAKFSGGDRIANPYTRSTQFYSSGKSSVRLPVGIATIKVLKGPEYEASVEKVEINAHAAVEREIALKRWIDMPKKGWFSADDHLHIARPTAEQNPIVSMMMQAEDVHVANLLQMGKVESFAIAKQYAHGPDGLYQDGDYILAAGQENPRTHFLGHTITLGAATAHNDPAKYLIYRYLWEQTAKEGAINGFAHLVAPSGFLIAPDDGIAVVVPHNLLHFVEVLQFNRSGYDIWYDLLALGLRVTPTAGTDYPCGGQTLPGHERFYTKVEGPLTYAKWLESVRHGRTFVTTGPLVDFRVDGQDIGSEIVLDAPSTVELAGSVAFDPKRDDLAAVELLQNGNVVERFSRLKDAAKIEFKVKRHVDESSWFAVRGYGARIDENTFVTPLIFSSFQPTSNVHTAPIYVTLKGRPGIEKSAHSKAIARSFLARLDDLERVLEEDNLDVLAAKLASPNLDGVPRATLLNNAPELLMEIQEAKDFFRARAQ